MFNPIGTQGHAEVKIELTELNTIIVILIDSHEVYSLYLDGLSQALDLPRPERVTTPMTFIPWFIMR